jgi:hypothetical protein
LVRHKKFIAELDAQKKLEREKRVKEAEDVHKRDMKVNVKCNK